MVSIRSVFLLSICFLSIPAVAQTVTLRVTSWASLEELRMDAAVIEEFERLHPDIDVLYEPTPGLQYQEKILASLAAGDAPDVILLDSKVIPTFTNKRILLDLNAYIEPLGIDTTIWYSHVLDIARRDSSLFAFPKGFSPLAFYYNAKLFRRAGILPPRPDWTWDDYLAIAKRLTVDTDGDGTIDQYGTAFSNYYYFWIVWVWSAGGDVVDPTGTFADGYLNGRRTEAALQFLIDLQTRHNVAPNVGSWVQTEKTGANLQLFATGRIGMLLDGHWRMPTVQRYMNEGDLEVGVAPLPRHPSGGKVNVMYESGWSVPVSTSHPEEAVLLAAFMAGDHAARVRSSGKVLELPAVRRVAEEIVANDTLGWEQVFVSEIPSCRQPWGSVIERFSEIEWTLQDAVDEVMLNASPIHETMTAYAAKVDRQLASIRKHATSSFAPIRSHSEIIRILLIVSAAVFVLLIVLYLRARRGERASTARALAFLTPSLVHLTVFLLTPIAFSAYLSVHRWDIIVPDTPFVGFDQFREMAGDPEFWNALGNTFVFALNVPIGMIIALAVALALNRRFRGVTALRAIYFLPSVTSFVAIALVWMWIYHPTFGAANYVLTLVGLPPQQWLNSTDTAMLSVIVFTVWMGMGYQMVIFLAGLQGIPDEYYEAARIDGAGRWQRLARITLPLMKSTTFFVLITSFISSFQVFTTIYVMTAGGPVGSTDVVVYHIYKAAWEQLRMGYASAMAWVLFVIIVIATWIQFRIIGRNVEYS